MTVDIMIYAAEVTQERVMHKSVAVIDVFRATSVIVEALRNGASKIIPVVTVEDAWALCDKYGRNGVMLGGERESVKIDGFDLDNSPLNYRPDLVKDKTIIFTTTNGTRAIFNSRSASSIFIGSFLNMGAVCRELAATGKDVVLVCSGRHDRFTAEDALCAGAMAGILALNYGFQMTDIAEVMQHAYATAADDIKGRLKNTTHYRYMADKGYHDDIKFCLQKDIYDIAPRYTVKGEIVV